MSPQIVEAGVAAGSFSVIDTFVIPNVDDSLFPAIAGTTKVNTFDALGIIEAFSVAALIEGADAAVLVMNNTPEDLRLVMIDPKMVELVRFNGLPHMYGKVETNLERILAVLRWTVIEMDRRYKLLEASHSRNIDTYNRKARRRSGVEPLHAYRCTD